MRSGIRKNSVLQIGAAIEDNLLLHDAAPVDLLNGRIEAEDLKHAEQGLIHMAAADFHNHQMISSAIQRALQLKLAEWLMDHLGLQTPRRQERNGFSYDAGAA